jgi:hypothetical protein
MQKKQERVLMIWLLIKQPSILHLIPLLFIYKSVPIILESTNIGKAFFGKVGKVYCDPYGLFELFSMPEII